VNSPSSFKRETPRRKSKNTSPQQKCQKNCYEIIKSIFRGKIKKLDKFYLVSYYVYVMYEISEKYNYSEYYNNARY